MTQLKTMLLNTDDAIDVDANSLLTELTEPDTHGAGTPPNAEWDSDAHVHSNELEQSPDFPEPSDDDPTEDPPSPAETK